MLSGALLCLAMVVNGEARGEPLYGQVAVAMVVLNRAHETRRETCEESRRYAQFVRRTGKGMDESFYAANIARQLYPWLPAQLRDNWYFHTTDVNPRYGHYNQSIGHHRFYTR